MKLSYACSSLAALVFAASISLGLSACGGGSTASTPVLDTSGSSAVVALKTIDTVVGSGVAVNTNNKV